MATLDGNTVEQMLRRLGAKTRVQAARTLSLPAFNGMNMHEIASVLDRFPPVPRT